MVVLKRAGQYIKERELFRYMGVEPFIYRERHSFDLIINGQYGGLDGLEILNHRQSKMASLCRWLIGEFRIPNNQSVSDIPFQHHRAIDRYWFKITRDRWA